MPDRFDFLRSDIIEIKLDHHEETYRVIYVAKFEEAIYVLHSFQKKSKRGRQIPKQDREIIEQRYRDVLQSHPGRATTR